MLKMYNNNDTKGTCITEKNNYFKDENVIRISLSIEADLNLFKEFIPNSGGRDM